ncbi:hypothetical protein ADIS_2748 [Lunatimonas lonarensis]|uniref:Lipoprotein n=1 Tax=Lunatimonas lonarensis TaxID=1232681 RepID=R7ZS16_9BACT|nr:hypothetical protein [Lunatimonas lonarensis]EON76877.1 hypothetical protein ADIS_2748 [Lunatimonas lonarensis]
MSYLRVFILLASLVFSACGVSQYDPGQLAEEEREQLMYQMVRYYGKLPKRHADHQNKFEERFDSYYLAHAKEHEILAYHYDGGGREYLLIKREAPSLYKKYVATGILFERSPSGDIRYYEEVFRTWKMPEEQLKQKATMLFTKMVKGEDLSPYLPENSGEEEYIEFPDKRNAFDPSSRRWLSPSLVAR